ncbi:hypothetical protein C8Q76DRAFT_753974 [Earliella scabrosa]|nr:hypothetical protein C8Q76DRAFT_753974 [Earliella scabrosa]
MSDDLPATATKDEEFWLEDGTVILVTGYVQFRVYSGILANHSTVFKEIFSEPHFVRHVSVHGGHDFPCPVVRLSDSPHDLRHLLRVYMPHEDSSLYKSKSPSFAALSARIRLGRKYQMTAAYEQSLQYLKSFFTHDFDIWNKHTRWTPDGWKSGEAIGVVNLAQLIGEPLLLPTALLACVQLGSDVVAGFTREDGSQEHLTLQDLGLCIEATTEIHKARVAAVLSTFTHPLPTTCQDQRNCKIAVRKALSELHTFHDEIIAGDPLGPHLKFVKNEKLPVCKTCAQAMDRRHRQTRLEMWNRLPELLNIDVPGWVPAP